METTLKTTGIHTRVSLRNTKGGDIDFIDNLEGLHKLLVNQIDIEDNFLNPGTVINFENK